VVINSDGVDSKEIKERNPKNPTVMKEMAYWYHG